MGGVIVHLFAAILCFVIVHMKHFKWEYSWAIFVGNFIPDVIKFGVLALRQGVMNIFNIEQDAFYHNLAEITSNTANWFTIGFFVLGTTLLLYHFHYIQKKKMEEYDELYIFLLVGIIIHLILDVVFIETGIWF